MHFKPINLTDKQQITLKDMMSFSSNELFEVRKSKDFYDYKHLLMLYFNPYLLYDSQFANDNLDFFINFVINRFNEEVEELKYMKETGQINSGEFKHTYRSLEEKYFDGSFIATNIYRIRENNAKVKTL